MRGLLSKSDSALLGSLGLAELLAGEPGSAEEQWALQREDLAAVGRLILVLACAGAPVATLDACAAVCSAELTRLLGALLDAPGGGTFQSWRQVGLSLQLLWVCRGTR